MLFQSEIITNLFSIKEPYTTSIDSLYLILGLEQITATPNFINSGVAVIKIDDKGDVISLSLATYDFTKINPEIFSDIIFKELKESNF